MSSFRSQEKFLKVNELKVEQKRKKKRKEKKRKEKKTVSWFPAQSLHFTHSKATAIAIFVYPLAPWASLCFNSQEAKWLSTEDFERFSLQFPQVQKSAMCCPSVDSSQNNASTGSNLSTNRAPSELWGISKGNFAALLFCQLVHPKNQNINKRKGKKRYKPLSLHPSVFFNLTLLLLSSLFSSWKILKMDGRDLVDFFSFLVVLFELLLWKWKEQTLSDLLLLLLSTLWATGCWLNSNWWLKEWTTDGSEKKMKWKREQVFIRILFRLDDYNQWIKDKILIIIINFYDFCWIFD